MPVPSSIADLSTSPGSNYPAGSESPAGIDDYLRFHAACIAQLRDAAYSGSDAVKLTGAQTIAGAKTFSSPIVGDLTGTATTATNLSRSVNTSGLATGGGALTADRTIAVPKASQAQAEAGTDDATAMTPLRTAQAIAELAKSIGVDQTYQTVTRTSGTDYQNTTGRTITLVVTFNGRGGQVRVGPSTAAYLQVSGNTSSISDDSNSRPVHTIPIPAGNYYRINGTINNVVELR